MSRIPIRIRRLIAVIAGIVVVAGVVLYLKSRPTVSLRPLFTTRGSCYIFNEDGSLITVDEYAPSSSGLGGPVIGQSIYDTKLGTVRLRLPSSKGWISFSSNSAFVAASGKGIYDLASSQLVLPLGSDHYWFSLDNRFVATTSDGVYELASRKQVISATGYLPSAFSRDSHYVALIGDGGGDTVYDLTTGQRIFSAPREKGFGFDASFSPDGKYLAVESDGLYEVATGKKIASTGDIAFTSDSMLAGTWNGVFDLTSGKRILPEMLAKDTDTASSKFSSDGRRVSILTYEPPANPNGPILTTVYDIPTRKALIQVKTPPEGRVFFTSVLSPDGQSLAVWHDGVYDVASGKKRFSIDPKGGSSTYTSAPLSFSKDNSLLYVSNSAAYDVQTGSIRFVMNGDTLGGNMNAMGDMLKVSNDGRLLSDYVGVYDFATGIRLAEGAANIPPNGNKVGVSSKTKGTCTVFEIVPAS